MTRPALPAEAAPQPDHSLVTPEQRPFRPNPNLVSIAAITQSTAVLETTPSSARVLFGRGGHFGRRCHGGFHWHNHSSFRFHYRYRHHYRYGRHRWGYHFGGYRPVFVAAAPAVCPVGTRLG